MRLFATLSILGLLTGCPSAPTPTKADIKKEGKSEGKASQGGEQKPPSEPAKPIEFEPPTRAEPSASEGAISEPATPAWFDTAKIDHAKILQAKNQAKVGTSMATAMLLEMQPGTTPQDCIAAVRATMLETVPDVVEPVAGDKGRMTLQGKTGEYSYTVVCGPGKDGQTTSYLSYTGL
ncbi:hypothetical protein ACNOYE_05865 [Nannocystaceae bacterium ST9]